MLQVIPKRGEINQSHGFLHKIKQQNEVKVINDSQTISPIKDLGAVKI